MVPLTRTRPEAIPRLSWNTQDQWITEVETWFMKAVLDRIPHAKNGARFSLASDEDFRSLPLGSQYSLCGRVLFRHGNYTNINWIGLWATTSSLLLICIISYTISRTRKILTVVFQRAKKLWARLRAVLQTAHIYGLAQWMVRWPVLCGSWGRPSYFQRRSNTTAQTELDDEESRPHTNSNP